MKREKRSETKPLTVRLDRALLREVNSECYPGRTPSAVIKTALRDVLALHRAGYKVVQAEPKVMIDKELR